ncbi:MAG: hypothetical protein JXR44_02650 [Thiotrichales bacterium]|nr:hypothetical protein [Thiotrichales bacterium]
MKTETLELLNLSVQKLLRPLVRILIRNGVASAYMENMVRKVFVEEAHALSQQEEGKTTISRIAARTGLARKEVKRLLEEPAEEALESLQKFNRATRVLSAWHNHSPFADAKGKPQPLSLNGGEPSFAQLVKSYSGDMTVKAMLDLLIEANCVAVEGEQVVLQKVAYLPSRDQSEMVAILGEDGSELLRTIEHNILCDQVPAKRFQRKVSTKHLDAAQLEAFKQISASQAQALLESLDGWLIEHEVQDPQQSCYVSLGIYFYQHILPESQALQTKVSDHETDI